MSKFTPGPWEWDAGDIGESFSHRYCDVYVDGGNTIIASVNENLEGRHANARLIAAAPEMYELLRTAMPSQYASAIDAEKWRLKRRALLARIDGESDDY